MGKTGPQRVPRWPQIRPEWPIKVERSSERAKNGPRSLPDKAEMAQHGPKTAPRLPKMAQERRQRGPRRAEDGPKIAQNGAKMGPRWPKMVPKWYQVCENEVKMGKIRPKRPKRENVQTFMKNLGFCWVGGTLEGPSRAQDG